MSSKWYDRLAQRLWAWATWLPYTRELKRRGWRRVGWMHWESPWSDLPSVEEPYAKPLPRPVPEELAEFIRTARWEEM